jgi:protein-S-isoprenylcysteine O-methyltransferase Ste14
MYNIVEAGEVNLWAAKVVCLLAMIVMVAIRAPHGQRRRGISSLRSRKGNLETVLLTIAWIAFFLPLIWIASPVLAFADYPLRPVALLAGALCLTLGLWLFYLSHADLGKNWSITLEVLESHRLVTQGVYRRIRHPMYTALLLYSVGQALALPNYVAGLSSCVSMGLLVTLRIGAEERMMLEEFGNDYRQYMARTKRLVPGVW